MTQTAGPGIELPAAADAAAHLRPARPPGPPGWAWAISLAAQVACAALSTSYTFFFLDDFVFLDQARTQPFDLTYLRERLFEHFSPMSRLLDKLLVVLSPGSFALAHGVELALYAAALAAFAFVVRWILANSWAAFAFTLAYGQSIFLMRLLNWWTATANILPATILMLLALGCYLRWRERRSGWLLGASLAAYAASLLDYETAILFPVYLGVILWVLEPRGGVRGLLAALRRERWAWCGYVTLAGLAIANYYAYYYSPPAQRPSLHSVLSFGVIALFDTFVPAMAGIKYPVAPTSHTLAIVASGVVLGGAVALALYLRPRAWRCLAAFAVVFTLTMLPLALTRIGEFGVSVAHVIYYQQSLQFMFLVLAALGVSRRLGGRRRRVQPAPARRLRLRPSRRTVAAAGTAAVALYAALYVTSLRAMARASWQPRQDRAFVSAFLDGVARVRGRTGREPVLIDLTVPKQVLPIRLWPYTTFGEFFALFDPRLRTEDAARRAYVVTREGHLAAVALAGATHGLIARARLAGAPAGAPSAPASGGCAPGRRGRSWLLIPLARDAAHPGGGGYVVFVRYRVPSTSAIPAELIGGAGGAPAAAAVTVWSSSARAAQMALDVASAPGAVAFRIPGGACVTAVVLRRMSSP